MGGCYFQPSSLFNLLSRVALGTYSGSRLEGLQVEVTGHLRVDSMTK